MCGKRTPRVGRGQVGGSLCALEGFGFYPELVRIISTLNHLPFKYSLQIPIRLFFWRYREGMAKG